MSDRTLTQRIRQNHAIEHATLTILSQRRPGTQLVARSDLMGFMVYGEVDASDLWAAADEAVERLRAGESQLAVHSNCGTNLVAAGTLSALAAMLASAGRQRTLWDRIPSADPGRHDSAYVLGTGGALAASQRNHAGGC